MILIDGGETPEDENFRGHGRGRGPGTGYQDGSGLGGGTFIHKLFEGGGFDIGGSTPYGDGLHFGDGGGGGQSHGTLFTDQSTDWATLLILHQNT